MCKMHAIYLNKLLSPFLQWQKVKYKSYDFNESIQWEKNTVFKVEMTGKYEFHKLGKHQNLNNISSMKYI